MQHKILWFIAILPPEDTTEEIRKIQHEIKNRFGPSRALRIPVHITLESPFRYGDTPSFTFGENLKKFFSTINSFPLELRNFGSFRDDVIFIEVTPQLALLELHEKLSLFLRENNIATGDFHKAGYTPHVTIANRDVDPHTHHEIWKEFNTRKFYAKFDVDSVALLFHDGSHWQIHQRFFLKPQENDKTNHAP